MWKPQRLSTLWAFTACYRDSFTFLPYLMGPHFLPARISGHNYLNFLLTHKWITGRCVFQYQYATPHAVSTRRCSTHCSTELCQWLPKNHCGRWTGRGREAPVSWPARSPDFKHLDYIYCWDICTENQQANIYIYMERGMRIMKSGSFYFVHKSLLVVGCRICY
jgi:hypothetical protein